MAPVPLSGSYVEFTRSFFFIAILCVSVCFYYFCWLEERELRWEQSQYTIEV